MLAQNQGGVCLSYRWCQTLVNWSFSAHCIARASSMCLTALFKLSTGSFLISFVIKERHQGQCKIDFYYEFFFWGAQVWVESRKPSGETPAESFSSEHPSSPSALLVRYLPLLPQSFSVTVKFIHYSIGCKPSFGFKSTEKLGFAPSLSALGLGNLYERPTCLCLHPAPRQVEEGEVLFP